MPKLITKAQALEFKALMPDTLEFYDIDCRDRDKYRKKFQKFFLTNWEFDYTECMQADFLYDRMVESNIMNFGYLIIK